MNKLPIKKGWLIVIAIIAVLIVGNPGKKQFKEFLGADNKTEVRRKYNFLIFSIWVKEGGYYNNDPVYFSIAWNFFQTGWDAPE